jgi:hypothetical protein
MAMYYLEFQIVQVLQQTHFANTIAAPLHKQQD